MKSKLIAFYALILLQVFLLFIIEPDEYIGLIVTLLISVLTLGIIFNHFVKQYNEEIESLKMRIGILENQKNNHKHK